MPFAVQSSYGQTDALALAVVEWLGTLDQDKMAVGFEAERRFRLINQLPEIPAWDEPASIDVFPDAEMGERQGMSTAFSSSYAIHIFIQQRLATVPDDGSQGFPSEDEQCALLTLLRSQIIEAIKKLAFDLTDAAHPVDKVFLQSIKSADKGLYNLQRLLEFHVYESDTLLIFKAAA